MKRLALLLVLSAIAETACAQSGGVAGRTATTPTHQSEHTFTRILSATALANDLVLVVDSREISSSIVDLQSGAVRPFAQSGAGPREIGLPWRLITFAGDSAAIVDARYARALVARSNGTPGAFVQIPGSPDGSRLGGNAASARVDARGALYIERRLAGDSLGIFRVRADAAPMRRMGVVALTPLPAHLRPQRVGGGEFVVARAGSRGVPIDAFPYPGEQWEVALDGWIAIASRAPYRVSWITPEGQRRDGPEIAIEGWPVTDATRRAITAELLREAPVRGGADSSSFRWQETLPAFATGRGPTLLIDRAGRAWVRRLHRAEDAPLYDVFDRTGRRLRQVRLARGERLVGFGAGAMLIAVRDADDLEAVRRVALQF